MTILAGGSFLILFVVLLVDIFFASRALNHLASIADRYNLPRSDGDAPMASAYIMFILMLSALGLLALAIGLLAIVQ
jgi:hypothetical protein